MGISATMLPRCISLFVLTGVAASASHRQDGVISAGKRSSAKE